MENSQIKKEDFAGKLEKLGIVPRRNELLKRHTTFQVGGPADYFVEIKQRQQLAELLKLCQDYTLPFFLLGNGSNVVFSDTGYRGVVGVLRGEFQEIQKEKSADSVRAGAGVSLSFLLKWSADQEQTGLELLAGVPGTVGGAVVTNAGTTDWGFGECVVSLEVLLPDGKIVRRESKDIHFSYRRGKYGRGYILSAEIRLKNGERNAIVKNITQRLKKRLETQPISLPNAGCIFRNPPGEVAGRLISAVGLSGKKLGGALVSAKHCNFIVNAGEAKAEDIAELAGFIRDEVRKKKGIILEYEVEFIGDELRRFLAV